MSYQSPPPSPRTPGQRLHLRRRPVGVTRVCHGCDGPPNSGTVITMDTHQEVSDGRTPSIRCTDCVGSLRYLRRYSSLATHSPCGLGNALRSAIERLISVLGGTCRPGSARSGPRSPTLVERGE